VGGWPILNSPQNGVPRPNFVRAGSTEPGLSVVEDAFRAVRVLQPSIPTRSPPLLQFPWRSAGSSTTPNLPVWSPVPALLGCGLAYQKMHMLRHGDIPQHSQTIAAAGLLQGFFKCTARCRCCEFRLAVIATEGNEMQVPRLLIPVKACRHKDSFT
jgi:hypothetical protein